MNKSGHSLLHALQSIIKQMACHWKQSKDAARQSELGSIQTRHRKPFWTEIFQALFGLFEEKKHLLAMFDFAFDGVLGDPHDFAFFLFLERFLFKTIKA